MQRRPCVWTDVRLTAVKNNLIVEYGLEISRCRNFQLRKLLLGFGLGSPLDSGFPGLFSKMLLYAQPASQKSMGGKRNQHLDFL